SKRDWSSDVCSSDLGALLPWDRMVEIYRRRFSPDMGARATDPRQVIGTFIIKHKLGLCDEETLLSIAENPYMQFFLGLTTFQPRSEERRVGSASHTR